MSDHKVEDTKGRVKEAVGDLTGDKALHREGEMDRTSATVKTAVDNASAATKKTVDKAAKAAKNAVSPKK